MHPPVGVIGPVFLSSFFTVFLKSSISDYSIYVLIRVRVFMYWVNPPIIALRSPIFLVILLMLITRSDCIFTCAGLINWLSFDLPQGILFTNLQANSNRNFALFLLKVCSWKSFLVPVISLTNFFKVTHCAHCSFDTRWLSCRCPLWCSPEAFPCLHLQQIPIPG